MRTNFPIKSDVCFQKVVLVVKGNDEAGRGEIQRGGETRAWGGAGPLQ